MPRMRDLLQRFRPTSAPGAASAGGVPADRQADLAAELRPLMEALEATQATCRAIIDDARAAADLTRAHARDEVGRIRASAPERAAAESADAAARLARISLAESEEEEGAARHAADRVTERAGALVPAYVQAVLDATGLR